MNHALTLFFALFFITNLNMINAQSVETMGCPPGQERKIINGRPGKCAPTKKKKAQSNRKIETETKLCSIKVKVSGEIKGANLTLKQEPCIYNRKKNRYNKSEIVDGGDVKVFSGFLCYCTHSLVINHPQYVFTDSGRIAIINPKPGEEVKFEARLSEKPKQLDKPCNEDIKESKLISAGNIPSSFTLSQQSSCRNYMYYNQHVFIPDVAGYITRFELTSDNLDRLQIEVLGKNKEVIQCVNCEYGTPTLKSKTVPIYNNEEYFIRITGTEINENTVLSYGLSVKPLRLTRNGYLGLISNVERELGAINVPVSTDSIFNTLSAKIESLEVTKKRNDSKSNSVDSNTFSMEKIEQAIKTLEMLAESVSEATNYDKAKVHSALGVIYRYLIKDEKLADNNDKMAIKFGGAARFRVFLGEEKKETGQSQKFWLLIKQGQLAIERMINSADGDKFRYYSEILSSVRKAGKHRSDGTLELQGTKTLFLHPMTGNANELRTISELIEAELRK